MDRVLLVSVCLELVLASTMLIASAQDVKSKESTEPKYKVSQKWSYKSRTGEENSYLVILKIETDPKLGKIIHIAMRGLKMKNRRSPDGISEDVNHMPFSETAIEKSGLKLLKEKVDLPDFAEGYRLWREAFDAGQAGIYTITIAEAVSVMEATLNQ
jgi:hypothetical protein